MKFLNLNALQSYLTIAITVIPTLLVALGCTQVGDSLNCSDSFLGAKAGLISVGVIGGLKLLLAAVSPGGFFRNLFEPKVPVSSSGATGTVSPTAVQK